MASDTPRENSSEDASAVVARMKHAAGVKTDAELAALLGVTKGAVPNWRKEGVPAKHLVRVNQRYGVPIEFLRAGDMRGSVVAELWETDAILRGLRDALVETGEAGAIAEAVLAIGEKVPLGASREAALEVYSRALALALVEAEQEYRAERPGEDFRASQLAPKVVRILMRNRHLYDAIVHRGGVAENITIGLKTALGLPKDWQPSDKW